MQSAAPKLERGGATLARALDNNNVDAPAQRLVGAPPKGLQRHGSLGARNGRDKLAHLGKGRTVKSLLQSKSSPTWRKGGNFLIRNMFLSNPFFLLETFSYQHFFSETVSYQIIFSYQKHFHIKLFFLIRHIFL